MDEMWSEFETLLNAAYDEYISGFGRFNLIVLGDSGAGKTTLINSFFGIDTQKTGVGKPVTKHIRRCMRNPDDIITIFDTPGFELGKATEREILIELSQLIDRYRNDPVEDQIHAVWFVVNTETKRFMDAHEAVVRKMHDLGLPVAIVLTHVRRIDAEIDEKAVEFARTIEDLNLPISGNDGKVLLVNSVPIKQLGNAEPIPKHGLQELLIASIEMAPIAANAIKASQRVDLSFQREEAKRIIRNFRYVVATAGATAATPVPLTDSALVAAAIAAMIAKITACYGLPIPRAQIMKISTAAIFGVGAAQKGTVKVATALAAKEASRVAGRATEMLMDAAQEIAKEGAEQAAKAAAKEGAEQAAKSIGEKAAKRGLNKILMQSGKVVPIVNLVIGAVSAGLALVLATAVGYAWMYTCEYLLRRPSLLDKPETRLFLNIFWHYYQKRGATPPGEGEPPADPVI